MNLRRGEERPLVVGHRGAGKVVADNSLDALAAAVAAGADLVEFDVVAGLFLGHSTQELPERPVTLDEALALLAPHAIGVYLDLKDVGIEPEIAAAVRAHGLAGRVIVSTTWAESLRRLARVAPELPRVLGYPRDRLGAARVRWPRSLTVGAAASLRAVMPLRAPALVSAAGANVLALHHALISPAVVRATHARGAAVFAWPVNDPELVARVAATGVDAIISGDPEMALGVLATLDRP